MTGTGRARARQRVAGRIEPATAIALAALAALTLRALCVPRDGLAWEAGNLAGLAALLLYVALCLWPVRPRREPAARPLALLTHRDLGFVALAATLLHVAVLLVREPLLIEHLKPTAPLYMLAGLVGLACLTVLVVAGCWPLRRRYATPARFQAWHIAAACLGLAPIGLHAIAAGRYARGSTGAGLTVLAAVTALLVIGRARRHGRASGPAQAALSQLVADSVCPRYGWRLAALALGAALVLLACLAPLTWAQAHRSPLAHAYPLPVVFPHERHRAVNCVRCHHNFTDHTGASTCVVCHRAASDAIKLGAEPRFHAFCEGCHQDTPGADGRRGPIRGCAACHDATLGGGARG